MKIVYFEINNEGGDLNLIETNETELPKAEAFSVVVEVKACGLHSTSSQVLRELFLKNPQLYYPAACDLAGVIVKTGSSVSSFSCGDRVAGILPLDSGSSGCANFCVSSEFDLVKIPDGVSFEKAAAAVGDGVKAYTALQYLGHVRRGETVLLTDPLSHWGLLAFQLCQSWGVKVLAVSHSDSEKGQLADLNVECIIDGDEQGGLHVGSVMEETGGLGADIVIDNGVRLFTSEEDRKLMKEDHSSRLPHKHDLISCLAVGGRLVTSHPSLQLDPPDSALLHLKCASVGFLFPHAWVLSSAHLGRYQHILHDVMQKLASGSLQPQISRLVTLSEVTDVLKSLGSQTGGKIVMKT